MGEKNSQDVTFQITVGQLRLSSRLAKEDVRVTINIGDISKITCSGRLLKSRKGSVVTWNHPFLFSAPPSMVVRTAICILPEKLTTEWSKQPLGDQIVTDVADLLKTIDTRHCKVPGLVNSSAILSVTCRASNILVTSDGHNCLAALRGDDNKLYDFGRKFKNIACMLTKVEVNQARLDLCTSGHPEHSRILNDLAVAFYFCHIQEGNILDLVKAMELQQSRLDLCSPGHPEYANALGWLALSLWRYYYVQKNLADLDRLIKMQEKWLDLCPLGHSMHITALSEHIKTLREHYLIHGDIEDLNKSIVLGEKGFEVFSVDDEGYSAILNNLALSINARYRKQNNLTDLNKAISLQETYLQLCPPGYSYHGLACFNLGISLWDRYNKEKNHSDLNTAIKLFQEASHTFPAEHTYFALNTGFLAATLLLSSTSSDTNHPSDSPLPSLDEGFKTYQLLKRCSPAVSLNLLQTLQNWVKNAEKYNHSSVLDAYQTLLDAMDRFASFTSSLDSRHEAMQARVGDLPNNAFSCALRHDDFQMAAELLEKGRGILWNQLGRCDISVVALEGLGGLGSELARKFMHLSADLKKHAQHSNGEDKNMEPYWRVQEEWRLVVDNIRRLDGFSQFLLPLCFEELQQAAEYGPVIIVNASEYSCDALIVLRTQPPVHVPLPCSFADVNQLCKQLSELTRDPHAFGDHRDSWVKMTLREMWSIVVEPIASILQNDIRLPPGSRIWWCPTSKFTSLPLHAAGPHGRGKKNFFDIYIPSYAPSLSALLRACDRIRSQRAARDTSGNVSPVSFAAIGQGRPTADTKLGNLPEVEHEIQRIQNETGMPPDVKFDVVTGAAASVEGAICAFRDHRWIHLACHGAQHPSKPFESWFAMGDGKLTLMRIIQENYTNSEFAFLSACHTAVGDASTPDEVLHLAAGMQFAGFNGVVGTLWKVDDAVAHKVVTRFYSEMFRHPVVSFEHAAAALNTAVLEAANEVPLDKRIVFVHIGI